MMMMDFIENLSAINPVLVIAFIGYWSAIIHFLKKIICKHQKNSKHTKIKINNTVLLENEKPSLSAEDIIKSMESSIENTKIEIEQVRKTQRYYIELNDIAQKILESSRRKQYKYNTWSLHHLFVKKRHSINLCSGMNVRIKGDNYCIVSVDITDDLKDKNHRIANVTLKHETLNIYEPNKTKHKRLRIVKPNS